MMWQSWERRWVGGRFGWGAGMLVLLLTACGGGLYDLPPAPPASEWVSFQEQREESDEERVRRFLDAKRAAIQIYAALAEGRWERAVELMSQETVAFFEDASNGAGAEAVLAAGVLSFGDEQIPFDPLVDLFIADLEDLRDEVEGQVEAETRRRKELFAISRQGQGRKIIMIYERDGWRLHSPFIRTPTFAVP